MCTCVLNKKNKFSMYVSGHEIQSNLIKCPFNDIENTPLAIGGSTQAKCNYIQQCIYNRSVCYV